MCVCMYVYEYEERCVCVCVCVLYIEDMVTDMAPDEAGQVCVYVCR